ncbi:MAG: LysE family transporter [Boseongicola sp.]|nr:LysE family transporter [Boseongicola sp.]
MSFSGWLVFSSFWIVFVTTPGPNAVNCIQNGLSFGFLKSLWGVLAILVQAALFLGLSAVGVTALLAASPELFWWLRLLGALVLIGLGIRTWQNASSLPDLAPVSGGSIFGRAFLIATVNAKSVAGYIAAFSQFVEPGVPMASQIIWILPTALTITAASYVGYTAIGVALGRAALGAVFNVYFRRAMAVLFVTYGVLLIALGQQLGTS